MKYGVQIKTYPPEWTYQDQTQPKGGVTQWQMWYDVD